MSDNNLSVQFQNILGQVDKSMVVINKAFDSGKITPEVHVSSMRKYEAARKTLIWEIIKADAKSAKEMPEGTITEETQQTLQQLQQLARKGTDKELNLVLIESDNEVLKELARQELKRRSPTVEDLQEASKNTSEKDLRKILKESGNEIHRKVAHVELARRKRTTKETV